CHPRGDRTRLAKNVTSAAGSLAGAGPDEQGIDVGPELLPGQALVAGQPGEGAPAADAGEGGGSAPEVQGLPRLAGLGGAAFRQLPGPGREVGAEPGQGLPPPAQASGGAQSGGVLALTAAGQRGGARGVVAVGAGEAGLLCQRRGVQGGGGGE